MIPSHRGRGTDATVTTDGAIDDVGDNTVWK